MGCTLGRLLADAGQEIVCVVSRTAASARKGGRFLSCRNVATSLEAIPRGVNLVFVATPHAAIGEVSRGLAGLDHLPFNAISVCHTSGIHTAEALEAVGGRGATVFSFHPLQTFPRDFSPRQILPSARGIVYGVDGPPAGVRRARALARLLGGRIVVIPADLRVFYHAACVVASNHLTALLWVLERMTGRLGESRGSFSSLFSPIISATLANAVRTSPAASLSGPVSRGGVETVAMHFVALEKAAPDLLPYFAAMTRETVKLARAKGSIDERAERALMDTIERSTMRIPAQGRTP